MTTEQDKLDELHHAALAINHESVIDDVAMKVQMIEAAKKRIAEIEADMKRQLIEWIEANGPLVINETKYYVGDRKDTKCVDVPATVQALLEATGGDFGKVCECLASQPVKHGASKRVLSADQYDALFKVETVPVLKEGVAQKQLQKVNTNFLR